MSNANCKRLHIVLGIIAAVLAAAIAVGVVIVVVKKHKRSNNRSFISSAYEDIEYVYVDDTDTTSESASQDGADSATDLIPQQPPKKEIPVYDTPLFTANEVGSLFAVAHYAGYTGMSTKTYVYMEDTVKDFNDFILPPMYQSDYIDINTRKGIEQSKAELQAFANEIIPKTKNIVDAKIDIENIKERSDLDQLEIEQKINEKIWVQFTQRDNFHQYSFSFMPQGADEIFSVNGVPFNVCQTYSENEIAASLEGVKQILFDTFGVQLDKVEVDKETSDSTGEATVISVEYYDTKTKERITLYFFNTAGHYTGKTHINTVFINYWRPRGTSVIAARAKMISLAEAEEYLKKGYVFSEYMCPECDTDRVALDFSEYDYVGIRAIYHEERKLEIPFYTFYKHIGTSPLTGEKTYGITYVPATPISGLDEYMANREIGHTKKSQWTTETI